MATALGTCSLRTVVSPGRTLWEWFVSPGRTLWERNHCERPFAFPSSMRVHVTPMSKRQMTSLPLSLRTSSLAPRPERSGKAILGDPGAVSRAGRKGAGPTDRPWVSEDAGELARRPTFSRFACRKQGL